MKSNQFIKLHHINNNEVYINSMMISKIYNSGSGIRVKTLDGNEIKVNESVEEIFKLIDKADTITLKTY